MVRVIIERKIKEGCEIEFWEMASQLRAAAVPRNGYVSGETWVDQDEPRRCIVISTWLSHDAWETWERSPQRRAIAAGVEPLLEAPAKTVALRPPQGVEVHWDVGMPVA